MNAAPVTAAAPAVVSAWRILSAPPARSARSPALKSRKNRVRSDIRRPHTALAARSSNRVWMRSIARPLTTWKTPLPNATATSAPIAATQADTAPRGTISVRNRPVRMGATIEAKPARTVHAATARQSAHLPCRANRAICRTPSTTSGRGA